MAKKKNRNIVLLKNIEDLNSEILYENFEYKKYFSLICKLIPDKSNEKLIIREIDKEKVERDGLVYIFVIGGRIFKIGLEVEVFAFFPQSPRYTLFGKEYQDAMPVTKRAEKEIMNSFVTTFGKKPIGCTQK